MKFKIITKFSKNNYIYSFELLNKYNLIENRWQSIIYKHSMKVMKNHKFPNAISENYSPIIVSDKSKPKSAKRDLDLILNKDNLYDMKEEDIDDIEKLTNSTIIQHIGNGGFSTVKLIYNKCHNTYFAMKVVNVILIYYRLT